MVQMPRGKGAVYQSPTFEPDIIDPLIRIFVLLLLVIDQNNKSNYIHISRSSDNRRHIGECICDKIHLSPLLCHIMAYPMRNGKFLWCFYIFFLLYCDILNVIQQQQKLIFQMPIKIWFFYLMCLHWMMVKLGKKKMHGKRVLSYCKTKSLDHVFWMLYNNNKNWFFKCQ